MAGIYIHIPFCKKACNYCNFHFSTSLQKSDAMINAINTEIEQRFAYLNNKKIDTIYFGGGTPSILNFQQLSSICETLKRYVNLEELQEFTIECNPDDINETFLNNIQELGINRISLGVQSFKNEDLQYMNRAHNSTEAIAAIQLIQSKEMLLSIDLIYGTPGLSNEEWQSNLNFAISLDIPHISAYALTVEPQTNLALQIKKGIQAPIDDETAAFHFEILVNSLTQAGYEQYEISNFAINKKYALHNTNYWRGKWYLGIGPSAHSFNGSSRSWNIANNSLYIQHVIKEENYQEVELLSNEAIWNEYIMTALRTMWGIDKAYISNNFPSDKINFLIENIEPFIHADKIIETDTHYFLTTKGKLIADGIACALFIV